MGAGEVNWTFVKQCSKETYIDLFKSLLAKSYKPSKDDTLQTSSFDRVCYAFEPLSQPETLLE